MASLKWARVFGDGLGARPSASVLCARLSSLLAQIPDDCPVRAALTEAISEHSSSLSHLRAASSHASVFLLSELDKHLSLSNDALLSVSDTKLVKILAVQVSLSKPSQAGSLLNSVYALACVYDAAVRSGARSLASFPSPPDAPLTPIASLILPILHAPLAAALLYLGYHDQLPSPSPEQQWARLAILRLLNIVDTPTAFASLFSCLPTPPKDTSDNLKIHQLPPPSWSLKPATFLLNQVVARPSGIRGLLVYITAGGGSDAPIQLIETSARLIISHMQNISQQELQQPTKFPLHTQLFDILHSTHAPQNQPPAAIVSSTCQIIARLVQSNSPNVRKTIISSLHSPFYVKLNNYSDAIDNDFGQIVLSNNNLGNAIVVLSTLIANVDPSSTMQRTLISPVLGRLFGLYVFINESKNTKNNSKPSISIIDVKNDQSFSYQDDVLLESVFTMLVAWGQRNDPEAVVEEFCNVLDDIQLGRELGSVDGQGISPWYGRDDSGHICIRTYLKSFEGQEELGREEQEHIDDDYPLAIHPDPKLIVSWLKTVGVKGINSQLLLRWLDDLKDVSKDSSFETAKRALLRMELVNTMLDQLGPEMLTQAKDMIKFVEYTLESVTSSAKAKTLDRNTTATLDKLRIIDDDQVEQSLGEEEEEEEREGKLISNEQLFITGVSVLLSVLSNSAENITNDQESFERLCRIEIACERVAQLSTCSASVASVCREAQRVIFAYRMATRPQQQQQKSSTKGKGKQKLQEEDKDDQDSSIENVKSKYQQATKQLASGEIPLRAQAIAQLRKLCETKWGANKVAQAGLRDSILSIMIQNVQEEEDSFIYLNAIQGLATLADMYGIEIAAQLCKIVADRTRVGRGSGFDWNSAMGERELDKRIRLCEALLRIVEQAGSALAVFVHLLLDGLLGIVGDDACPVVMRVSALSIISAAVLTSVEATSPWIDNLVETVLDLLKLEVAKTESEQPTLIREMDNEEDGFETTGEDGDEDEIIKEEKNNKITLISTDLQLKEARKAAGYDESIAPTSTQRKHPSLRRAALVLLGVMIDTDAFEYIVDDADTRKKRRIMEIVQCIKYVATVDVDGLVRSQATVLVEKMKEDLYL